MKNDWQTENKWKLEAKDSFDKPFRWKRENVPADGKLDVIEDGDKASFVFVTVTHSSALNVTTKENEPTIDFRFGLLGEEGHGLYTGWEHRLIISVRAKDKNDNKVVVRYSIYLQPHSFKGLENIKVVREENHPHQIEHEKKRLPIEHADEKPKLKYSRFHRRAVHLEWKINADAHVVNNYLLQHYVGILIVTTVNNVRYEIDKIESFDPKQHEVFQYGFIAHGKKVTPTNKAFIVGGAEMTLDPRIETIPEIFLITISQGKKDVSILSFDTDNRDAHQFTVGLVRELSKAFNIQLI